MENPNAPLKTSEECFAALKKVLACLDHLAAKSSGADAQQMKLASAHLQHVIDLLGDPKPN